MSKNSLKAKCLRTYEESGVGGVEDTLAKLGVTVIRERCNGCDCDEAPTLPGTHECLYCGSTTNQ